MTIKLCKKFPKQKKLAKKLSLNFPDAEIQIKSCLGMCKHCKSQPTAIVDGKKIKKKSITKLISSIQD